MQNRLMRSRGIARYFVTCALGIGATENPKLSLLYVLILCLHHDTAKFGYSRVVKESTGECNGTLLSSVMRVGSVCMRVVDLYSTCTRTFINGFPK